MPFTKALEPNLLQNVRPDAGANAVIRFVWWNDVF